MRAFQLNNFLDHGQRSFRRLPSAFNTVIRIEYAHDARNPRLRGPSAGIARKADRAGRRTMIRAITRHNLVAPSEEARNLDSVFIGFSAAVRKKESINIARSN